MNEIKISKNFIIQVIVGIDSDELLTASVSYTYKESEDLVLPEIEVTVDGYDDVGCTVDDMEVDIIMDEVKAILEDPKKFNQSLHEHDDTLVFDTTIENGEYNVTYSQDKETSNNKQIIIDKVLEQIKEDVECGDVTAIEELLKSCPEESLTNYLPEVE